jgi:hypothetical protein
MTTRFAPGAVSTWTFVGIELAAPNGAFIDDAIFTLGAIAKRFVLPVLPRTFSRKHLGTTTLGLSLWNVLTTIVPTRRATITTWTPAIITALTTRLPLTTRTPAIITALTTRLPLTTRRTITPTLTTRTPAIITALTTRLPLPTRCAAASPTPSSTLTTVVSVVVVSFFAG